MSAPLNAEEKAEYTRIIDEILNTSDLLTVTRKKIRQGLQDAINKDLSGQKDAIKLLIEARFDAISADAIPTPPSAPTIDDSPKLEANGRSPSDHADPDADADADAEVDAADDDGEIEVVMQPAKKKQKRESSTEDADARLAAQLQAQEEALARGRTTRGRGTAKVPKKAKGKNKTPKKKSEKRVRDENSDGDVSGSESGEKPKKKAGGGFQKPFNLSYPLAELCAETQLSRPQVVKKLWAHIKANELQDPKDKRQIRCDDMMLAIFKQSKVDMFQMNKLLGNHLYPIEEA